MKTKGQDRRTGNIPVQVRQEQVPVEGLRLLLHRAQDSLPAVIQEIREPHRPVQAVRVVLRVLLQDRQVGQVDHPDIVVEAVQDPQDLTTEAVQADLLDHLRVHPVVQVDLQDTAEAGVPDHLDLHTAEVVQVGHRAARADLHTAAVEVQDLHLLQDQAAHPGLLRLHQDHLVQVENDNSAS